MKHRRFNPIEDVFSRGLSDQEMLRSLDMNMPNLWPDIERQLGGSQLSKKTWIGLLACLLLFGAGGFAIFLTAAEKGSMPAVDLKESLALDGPSTFNLLRKPMENSLVKDFNEGNVGASSQPPFLDSALIERKMVRTASFSALDSEDVFIIEEELAPRSLESKFMARDEGEETIDQQSNLLTTTINLLDHRDLKVIPQSAEGLSSMSIFNSSKYWTLRVGIGVRSSDYFIQGNFSIDPNTRFKVSNQWSPSFQIEASYFMGKNVSVDFGIQYLPFRTRSQYQFEIPYSDSGEMIDQNRGRISIAHNVPSVGGGLAAESILERDISDQVTEGELIVLDADVEETLKVLTLPISSTLRLYSTGNFQVAARLGVALNIQISDLESEVVSLRSNNEKIRYSAFNVSPLENDGKRTLFAGYQLGIDTRWYINDSGLFLNGSINYANAFTPGFSFDAVNVYPRSWGLELGIGKALQGIRNDLLLLPIPWSAIYEILDSTFSSF